MFIQSLAVPVLLLLALFCSLEQWLSLLPVSQIFCPLVVGLAPHTLSSVIPAAWYLASPVVLGHHLIVQRICIWQFYLCVLIRLNKCLIVLCLNCYMFLELPSCFVVLVLYNDSTVGFENKHLNILNGMRFPSAPVYFICYFGPHLTCVWL